MAAAAAQRFGVPLPAAIAAMTKTAEVAGRYRTITVGGSFLARMLLAKNPAGWLEVFDLLSPPPAPVVIAINARVADGKDPSWLWDVPFERLAGRVVVATGERSRDLAVRLHYAGVQHRHEPDPQLAIASAASTGANQVEVVANYTAFQAISALAGHG
jgi:UDP-N-acetylmuramyl tripeptide synthase